MLILIQPVQILYNSLKGVQIKRIYPKCNLQKPHHFSAKCSCKPSYILDVVVWKPSEIKGSKSFCYLHRLFIQYRQNKQSAKSLKLTSALFGESKAPNLSFILFWHKWSHYIFNLNMCCDQKAHWAYPKGYLWNLKVKHTLCHVKSCISTLLTRVKKILFLFFLYIFYMI